MSVMDMLGAAPPMGAPPMGAPTMGAPPMGAPPMGVEDEGFPAPVEDDEDSDVLDLIKAALDGLDAYKRQEDDEENTLLAEQATSLLQKILANEQKMGSDALAGKMSPRLLSRAYS